MSRGESLVSVDVVRRGTHEGRVEFPATISPRGLVTGRFLVVWRRGTRGKHAFDAREARETSRGRVIYRVPIAGSNGRCVGRTLAATMSVAGGEGPGQQGFRGPCAITNARSIEPRLRCRPPEEPRVRAEPRPSLTPSRAETRVGDTCVVARARWYASATLSRLPLVGHGRLPRPPKADKRSQKRNERRSGILELQTLNHQIIPTSSMSAGDGFQFFISGGKRPAITQFVFHKHARAYARVGADGAGARREVST